MLWIKSPVQEAGSHLNHALLWMTRQDGDGNKICTGDNRRLLGEMRKSEGVLQGFQSKPAAAGAPATFFKTLLFILNFYFELHL